MDAPSADFCCLSCTASAPGSRVNDVWFCHACEPESSSGVTRWYCVGVPFAGTFAAPAMKTVTQMMCKRTAFPGTIHIPSTSGLVFISSIDTVITKDGEVQRNNLRQFRLLFPVAEARGGSYSWQAFKRSFASATFAFLLKI